jgi:hypothetical protein
VYCGNEKRSTDFVASGSINLVGDRIVGGFHFVIWHDTALSLSESNTVYILSTAHLASS